MRTEGLCLSGLELSGIPLIGPIHDYINRRISFSISLSFTFRKIFVILRFGRGFC